MRRAFLAAIIIGVVAPVVGTWVVLRRMANLGDAMSHGTLAGVGLADVLEGASVVVDVSNSPSFEDAAVHEFFQPHTTSGDNA